MADCCIRFCFKKWKLSPIILCGYSIGSGPATFGAKKYEKIIKLLILVGGYTSIREVLRHRIGFLSNLINERFPNLQRIKKYNGSLIIIHGKYDKTIPFIQGKELYTNCPSKSKHLIKLQKGHVFPEWNEYVFKPIFYLLKNLQ
jgi:fermentation-respiration switch protein FrsA (DUF1100 family)